MRNATTNHCVNSLPPSTPTHIPFVSERCPRLGPSARPSNRYFTKTNQAPLKHHPNAALQYRGSERSSTKLTVAQRSFGGFPGQQNACHRLRVSRPRSRAAVAPRRGSHRHHTLQETENKPARNTTERQGAELL